MSQYPMTMFIDRAGSLSNARRTAVGGMLVDATLAKVGVLEYGPIRRYNPPEVLMDAMGELTTVPVTNRHPAKFVDVNNYRELVAGHIVGQPEFKDGYIHATLAINDAALIHDIEMGIAREVSMGYMAEHAGPGVTSSGEHYDEARAKITWNHCAVVPAGRAGRSVRLMLDADGAIPQEETPMEPKIEETPVVVVPEPEPVTDERQVQIDTLTATVAALTADKTALEAALAVAQSDATFQARVAEMAAKVEAERTKSEKLARVKAGYPSISLDGRSDAFVDGLDAALAQREPSGVSQLDGTANEGKVEPTQPKAPVKVDRKAQLAAERRAASTKAITN